MDPIEFELFMNAIFSIADEMTLTVFRTTYSGVQGLTLPGHLGSVPTTCSRSCGITGMTCSRVTPHHERPVRL
jgi:hypothetical protein